MTVFTDDFTGTNGDLLESRSGWSKINTSVIEAQVTSNRIGAVNGASGNNAGFKCTSPGSADQYCQATLHDGNHTDFPLVCRFQDISNFGFGLRLNAGNSVIVARRSGAIVTNIATISITYTAGDTFRIEVEGTVGRAYQNGVQIGTDYTADTFTSETGVGILLRDAADSPLLDDWESGPLGGSADALTANNIDAGTPTTGTPSLGQAHALTATGVAAGAPSVASPSLAQVYALTASGVSAGTPTVGSPAVGQTHALTATGVASGTPSLGEPTLATDGTDALTATGIAAGTPSLGTPALGQAHALSAVGVAAGSPSLGTPVLGSGAATLTASDLTAGAPVLGAPTLAQVHALVAAGIVVGTPSLGAPQVNAPTTTMPPAIARGALSPAAARGALTPATARI